MVDCATPSRPPGMAPLHLALPVRLRSAIPPSGRASRHLAYHRPMSPLLVLAEDIGPKWLYWPWVSDHTDQIRARLTEHIELTVLAGAFGLMIALPLALLSVRYRWLYGPVLAITGVLYTIPSLALFAMLLPLTGLSGATALNPLTDYTLLILV